MEMADVMLTTTEHRLESQSHQCPDYTSLLLYPLPTWCALTMCAEEELRQQEQQRAAEQAAAPGAKAATTEAATAALAAHAEEEGPKSAYDAASGFKEVAARDLRQLMSAEAFDLLLDVRSREEYEIGKPWG